MTFVETDYPDEIILIPEPEDVPDTVPAAPAAEPEREPVPA